MEKVMANETIKANRRRNYKKQLNILNQIVKKFQIEDLKTIDNHKLIAEKITVKITQIKSPIGKEKKQLDTLKGLGLNKISRSKTYVLNSSIIGMINAVMHLLLIEII